MCTQWHGLLTCQIRIYSSMKRTWPSIWPWNTFIRAWVWETIVMKINYEIILIFYDMQGKIAKMFQKSRYCICENHEILWIYQLQNYWRVIHCMTKFTSTCNQVADEFLIYYVILIVKLFSRKNIHRIETQPFTLHDCHINKFSYLLLIYLLSCSHNAI
jgi:hypothetical protein